MITWLEILKAALFGLVEGITEWLPISSTGHMIILNSFVTMDVSPEFWDMFLVVIQLGAIIAVVVEYWHQLVPWRRASSGELALDRLTIRMWINIIVACIPAAVVGLLFDDDLSRLFHNNATVAIMLILFGIFFILAERRKSNRKQLMTSIDQITIRVALIIGLFQLIAAVFPGTSRSGATILGGLLIGMSRTVAAEFTFFLAVPVMFGASLLKIVKFGFHFAAMEVVILLTGMAIAFFVSILTIRFLMGYVKKRDFVPFGIYRIVLGIAVLAVGFLK